VRRRPGAAARAGWRRLAAGALLAAAAGTPAGADDALWAALRAGGAVVLLRHASTEPGVGDPPGYRLDDCRTQRNLSAAGREEARRIGAAFRARGVAVGEVLSSRWCRCLETARLAFGRAEPWPALDSFFDDRRREAGQTAALRARLAAGPGPGARVLVTHQVNITALTGIAPAPGEAVVLTPGPGGLRVAGRLRVAPPAPAPAP
jgi:phosphohistidine phosphatase SixA